MSISCILNIAVVVDREMRDPSAKPRPLVVPKSVLGYFGMPGPEGAVTWCFGRSINAVHSKLKADLDFLSTTNAIELAVNVGMDASTRIGLSDLGGVKVLNMLRMKSDLTEFISVFWKSLFKEGADENEEKFPLVGTKFPEKVAELRKHRFFKHIDLFIYPVEIGGGVLVVGSYFGAVNKNSITASPRLSANLELES